MKDCLDCRWYKADTHIHEPFIGTCFRGPPEFAQEANERGERVTHWIHPKIETPNTCGEWKPLKDP